MKKYLDQHFNLVGIRTDCTPEESAHIRTINEQSVYSFLACFIASLCFFFVPKVNLLATYTLIVSFGYLLPILLNKYHRYSLAIFTLNIWTHIIVTIASIFIGFSSNVHFIILLAAMTIKMDYQDRKTPLIVINFIFSYGVVLFLILNNLFSFVVAIEPVGPSEKYINYIVLILIVVVAQQTLNIYHTNTSEVKKAKKEKEEAEKLNKLKSTYLAAVSHELRNPITTIINYTHLLTSPLMKDHEKTIKFKTAIKARSLELIALLNDIMDASKIEQDELTIQNSSFGINEFLESVMMEFETLSADTKDKKIILDEAFFERRVLIETDEQRLRQIFRNLIQNAYKHTNEGEIKFGIKGFDENRILFYVKDTGTGIDQEQLERIFELYSQTNEGQIKANSKGIGLFVVHELLKRLNGSITVESEINVGSEFTFSIPFDPTLLPVEYPDINALSSTSVKGKTILLVEDDRLDAEITETLLKEMEVNVVHKSGIEDLSSYPLGSENIDLVLTDFHLEDGNGWDIKELVDKAKIKAPLILYTADTASESRREAFNRGFSDYLVKPLEKRSFLRAIEYYLGSNN